MVQNIEPVNTYEAKNLNLEGMGGRLRAERERLGLSQSALASIGSVGKTTQINYEQGNSPPHGNYLAAVSAVGVDVLYVVTGQRTPSKEEGLSPPESAVLSNFRALSEEDQKAVNRLTNALAKSNGDSGNEEVG